MLLWLADFIAQYVNAFQVFQYLTLRGILSVLTALAMTLLVGPTMIKRLNYHQIGQSIRDDGPASHFSKTGTPTMGGALILVGIIVSTLLWSDLSNRYVWTVLLVTIVFGAVGWVDDYRKVIEKNPRGLPARWKYFWQSVGGLGAALLLYNTAVSPVETQLFIPFFKNFALELGSFFVVFTRVYLFRYRRQQQCRQPDRRARRPGHLALRIDCRRPGDDCLPCRQLQVCRIFAYRLRTRCRRANCLLRRAGRRGSWLPMV